MRSLEQERLSYGVSIKTRIFVAFKMCTFLEKTVYMASVQGKEGMVDESSGCSLMCFHFMHVE